MKLTFYRHKIEYDGRELGLCAGSSTLAPYQTMDVLELEREARERPKNDFLRYIKNWHALAEEQLKPATFGLPEKQRKGVEATRDFCKELLDALGGK